MKNIALTLLLTCLLFSLPLQADTAHWSHIIHDDLKKPSLHNFAERNYLLFQHFLNASLRQQGKKDFFTVTKRAKNNIYWQGHKGRNIYVEAFKRSYPIVQKLDRQDMPEILFLIPYLESLWQSKSGQPATDYGYWQLVRPIVKEIQALPNTPKRIKNTHPNKIRSDAKLSTQVALIHLRRYYFYFAKVAKYTETDAWLFSIVSYNWGAGNVKRMLAKMKQKGIQVNFSNFYHTLYQSHLKHKQDKSLKAAVEYVPNLWNIANVIRQPT